MHLKNHTAIKAIYLYSTVCWMTTVDKHAIEPHTIEPLRINSSRNIAFPAATQRPSDLNRPKSR